MNSAKVPGAAKFLPAVRSITAMRAAVQSCQGCELYKHASQAVFGEGQTKAKLLLIGEQPGNEEDLQGHPFVGPAGKLLDRALGDAQIDRQSVYVTNAVKHFKFEERGKRRIHKKPGAGEVRACKPWLDAEIEAIHPVVIVCLGATAAQALLGNDFRLTVDRGRPLQHPAVEHVVATVHPSAILRAPDSEQRELQYARFVDDLKVARKLLEP